MNNKDMVLEISDLHSYYGTSHVLFGVSLRVARGESVCILGRNGAGKTTTLLSIMGEGPTSSGSIRFLGEETIGKPAYLKARMGIGFVPDSQVVFPDLTVMQNLVIAQRKVQGGWTIEKICEVFPILKGLLNRKGGHLSGGERQVVVITRALVSNPQLLIMDEPSQGLAPLLQETIAGQLRILRAKGVTMLLAEQNMLFAVNVCDRTYIIDQGEVKYEGLMRDIARDSEIQKKYLLV